MKLIAFSLLDTKACAFGVPFFMAHVGQAIRACMELGTDMSTTVGRHPADFALCRVGYFDDETGEFEKQHPENLGLVLNFLPRPQAPLPGLAAQHQVQPGEHQVTRQVEGE